jgi:hypothetical protein
MKENPAERERRQSLIAEWERLLEREIERADFEVRLRLREKPEPRQAFHHHIVHHHHHHHTIDTQLYFQPMSHQNTRPAILSTVHTIHHKH